MLVLKMCFRISPHQGQENEGIYRPTPIGNWLRNGWGCGALIFLTPLHYDLGQNGLWLQKITHEVGKRTGGLFSDNAQGDSVRELTSSALPEWDKSGKTSLLTEFCLKKTYSHLELLHIIPSLALSTELIWLCITNQIRSKSGVVKQDPH